MMQKVFTLSPLSYNYAITILNCPLFKEVAYEELNDLLNCLCATFKTLKEGEYAFHLGDDISYIYIVLEGSIEIAKENINGARNIVALLGESQLFGEGVVCTTKRLAPVSAKAITKTSLLLIPYEKILKTCGHSCHFHHQLIHNMMLLLGEKNYMLNHKIDLLMLKGMREKLATYLLTEAKNQRNLSFNIPLSRNELADYLNVSRPSMSRELGRMRDEGLIDYYKNTFKILKLEALQKNCE